MFLPVFVCLSVCYQDYSKTRAWIWMKCCVSTWTNWLRFEPDPDYSPDAGTGLLSPISYKRCYAEFYVGKIPRIRIAGPPLQRGVVLRWFYSPSRRNTFVGGTCALPSALLVFIFEFFTPPQRMHGGGYYVFTSPVVCPDVPGQHRHFFHFAQILNGFR